MSLCLQVIHIERPLRCQAWCCFCCLQKIEVQSPPGTVVGYVRQDLSFIYPWFTIENADGEPVLKIKGPCWTCKWCEVEFEVRYNDCHSCTSIVQLACVQSGIKHVGRLLYEVSTSLTVCHLLHLLSRACCCAYCMVVYMYTACVTTCTYKLMWHKHRLTYVITVNWDNYAV